MKALVAPIPLVLAGLLVAGILFFYGKKKRLALFLFLSSWSFLYFLSTPLATSLLLLSLGKGNSPEYAEDCPEFVIVLAGGYIHGTSPERDALHHYTSLRVVAAADRFKDCKQAVFIMAGANSNRRDAGHQARLMAELAIARGVDSNRIILEQSSRNTAEHVFGILELEAVSAQSQVAVVTSGWHVPRARDVFDPAFTNAVYYPVWQERGTISPGHFIPTTFALVENNIILTEWFGRLWYAVRY